MTGSGKSLKQRAYHELKEFLVMTIYLWVVLGLFVLYKSVVLAQYHINDGVEYGFAILNALALAKVDRKSTRLNSSHQHRSRMPSSA